MRIIPTKIHGMMDYLMGILLIGSPWLFNFAAGGAETTIPVIIGVSVLLLSLLTDYELGIIKKIPVSMHLSTDIMAGILLAASPWLFGFSDKVYVPHVVFGILEIGAGLMTQLHPSYRKNAVNTSI